MSEFEKQEPVEPQEAEVKAEEAEATQPEAVEAEQPVDTASEQTAAADDSAAEGDGAAKPKKPNRKPVIAGVIAVVAIVAVAGGLAWHEQPSFCNAICHTPMDAYLETYEAVPGEAATDKWGNEVSDASSMLASVHGQYGKTCLDCHQPELSEQMTEGAEWVTGSYDADLSERTTSQLLEARGIENSDEFCMNDSCHNYTREELEKKTAWMGEINPHTAQHGEQKCGTCHKAHRQSVMYCTQCHTEAVVPDGWIDYTTSKELEEASGTQS